MKMNTLERRILAMILAVAIFASNLTLGAAAEDAVYCGNEEHTHTEECYVNNAEPTADETESEETVPETTETQATEPETTEPETTEPEVTEPEVTEPVVTESEVTEPVCTCGSENDTHSRECALYVPTFFEQLLTMQTLKELHDVMMANPEGTYGLTAEELTALKTHAEELYAALTEPTQDEQDYYELITETVEVLAGELESESEAVTLDIISLTSAGGNLASGSYRLDSDIKLNGSASTNAGDIIIAAGRIVTIDLNGYMLEGSGKGPVIDNKGTLTIVDSNPDENVHYFRKVENDAWVLVREGEDTIGCEPIKGGIITGGRDKTKSTNGSGGVGFGCLCNE